MGNKFEYDEEGNLKIFKKWKKERELNKSARRLLLFSNKIIEVEREIVSWDTPLECNIIIKTPHDFNMKYLARLFLEFKSQYPPLSKTSYLIENNLLTINLISGSKRCSFCMYFLEYLDKKLPQEIELISNTCLDWTPKLKDKLPEEEYEKILQTIKDKRLEYFQTTDKYREEVLERDRHKCLSCGTDGKTPYKKRDGAFMKNPLQIHHMSYKNDSPDSLITLCGVCHYTLHRRLYLKTGKWSSKKEDMKLLEK